MKNFTGWGTKIRRDLSKNYYAIWQNLVTTRLDLGDEIALEPEKSEFMDVGITSRCNACCPFCYVSASDKGLDYKNISRTWKKWMATMPADRLIDPSLLSEDDPLKEVFDDKRTPKELLLDIAEIGAGKKKTNDAGEGIDDLELILKIKSFTALGLPLVETFRPYQIACGSIGEPTIHPEFVEFLQAVFETGVVPNYTTNGIVLSDYRTQECKDLLEATKQFCGGVAVSFGNKKLHPHARVAIENLILYGECKVVIHHLISDKASVDDMINLAKEYKDRLHYHVLLPLMAHGRSKEGLQEGVFEYMYERCEEEDVTNLAFGANFAPQLIAHPDLFPVYEYPREIYSKNVLLQENKVIITPSSFNLKPCKTIEL